MAASIVTESTVRDVCLLLEVREIAKKLYTPINTSLRIKYSCFAVSSYLIVLGANTGAVYVFVKDPISFISFIPNKERDIQIVRFSPDGRCIAVGTGCGVVIVWELNISQLQSSKKILEVSEHKGSIISDMIWDNKGQQLFIGDTNGKISVAHMPGVLPRTVLSSTGGIRLRKPGIILVCETPVVQLDYDNDHLLVSCKHKSAIMNLKREEVTYVGSQERDGLFGACFYRDTQSIPNHTLILSARPKARIWKASLDGKVELTYKLKDLLNGVKITPIYGERRSERPEEETPGAQNIPNILKRIRVINDHLVAWNANTLYLLNLVSNIITQHSFVQEIQDLHVFENDIWISQGDPIQIRCLSLLHCTQVVKALSQLQLQSQISEILLEFGESSGGTADAIPDVKTSAEEVPDPKLIAISPPIDKQILSIGTSQHELSAPVESTTCITPDEHITPITPLEEQQDIKSEVIGNEEIVLIDSEINNSVIESQELDISSDPASGFEIDKDIKSLPEHGRIESLTPPLVREEESLTQQSIELEAVYSVGIIKNSFDENSLPFPKVSRIRKTQSLRDGDLISNRSPKLVRKRSKKERSSGGREVMNLPRGRSESENEMVFEPSSELDPFAADIFKDISMGSERRSIQLDDSPISQHIPRSERKKKQKKRESKTEFQLSTDIHPSKQTDSIPQEIITGNIHSPDSNTVKEKESDLVELSRNNKIFEDFTLTSEQIWGDFESSEDDLSTSSQLLSSWLSSFVCLITSVPTSSLPGSHTITTLSRLSDSSHFHTLQQLAIYAMLSCFWQSLSFPNPLLPTASPASSDPYNFFYLQAPFLPISEVRCYLTLQHLLDRKRVYSLYSRGLQDFKETMSDLSSPDLLDIESQSFPLQIHKDLQSGIELCVRKFPCIQPWEIFCILFSNTESPLKLQSHLQSQIYLEYMEGLFLSTDEVASNSSLLKTAFTTDHESLIAWCCLSIQSLPSLSELSIKNNIKLPKPNSHLLEWKYKRVWELIFSCNIIPTELAEECLAHFKQHCFWLGVIACCFMLNRREEATVILLQLHDYSLLERSNKVWAKFPNSLSDWKLTIHTFLSVFDAEFTLATREETSDRISQILKLAVREIGCLSVIEILRDIIPPLEKTTSIKTWFPYELLLKLVQIVNIDKEKSKIAFHLLERLDEELWKQKPNAISLQFLLHENIPSISKENQSSFTLETSGFQWGIRAKRNEFRCQSCCTDIMSPLPVIPSDIQVFACGHSYHKACLLEEACTLCFSESII